MGSLRPTLALMIAAALTGCGGGGSGGGAVSTPPPAPAPTPSPAPAPTPTPTPAPAPLPPPPRGFDTPEFRRSDGPRQHGAITAWQGGATGAAQTIAIIDTGIDINSPEFAGRIDPRSRDVSSSRSIDAVDDHGTNIALVAAAARNGTGVMGIAFDASLLVLRADSVGSCQGGAPGETLDGCTFDDRDIARGISAAVSAGARVINISLGGNGTIARALTDAVAQASAAGVVVVVAAGNGGAGSESGTDPNQPSAFARQIREAGGSNVIIVGAVDANGTMSSFSQRAGAQAAWYLGARGEAICCVYKDGEVYVGRDSGGSFNLLFSGTSFATPQVAGAVALLAQAFPNLSGQQIVRLLLDTARDGGVAGIDSVYGSGILDIAAAFQPRGVTTLPGTDTAITIGGQSALGSAATGDALRTGAGLPVTVLDSFGRAYGTDLASGFRGAEATQRLAGALGGDIRSQGVTVGGTSLAFTVSHQTAREGEGRWARELRLTDREARGAELLAARVALRIAPKTQLALALREGSDGLSAQLRGADRPAFMIARGAAGDHGFAAAIDQSMAVRHALGAWGVSFAAETGRVAFDHLTTGGYGPLGEAPRDYRSRSFSLGVDRRWGPVDMALSGSWLQEDETILGTLLAPSFGGQGADTQFLDASGGLSLADGWRLGAQWRQGWTRARAAGLIASGSSFASVAWSADLTKTGFTGRGDSLGLRVSQPLRVMSGALGFTLPVAYDYTTLTASYDTRFVSLTPTGREIDAELAWRGPLWGGDAAASLFYRSDPGHSASAPDDRGVAVRWRRDF